MQNTHPCKATERNNPQNNPHLNKKLPIVYYIMYSFAEVIVTLIRASTTHELPTDQHLVTLRLLNASREALQSKDTMGKRVWKIEEKKEGTCVSPNTFPLHFFHLVDLAFV